MMNKFVCDIELSKELFKRGIIKDAKFWWIDMLGKDNFVTMRKSFNFNVKNAYYKACPAPIAEESIELMPEEINYYKKMYIKKINNSCKVMYVLDRDGFEEHKEIEDKKLSNACAKMLIWLDDNNYLEKE